MLMAEDAMDIRGASVRSATRLGFVETLVLCLAVCAATRAQEAQAQVSAAPQLRIPDAMQGLREIYPDLSLPRPAAAGERAFRPRAPAAWQMTPSAQDPQERRSLQSTTVWQRMRDFRAGRGVRLLTLWENAGGIVSLQASKHGDPSLQWVSRTLNRGGASRGLLDQLFSTALFGATERLRGPAAAAPARLKAPGVAPQTGAANR
jgi:hypothetical protein